ncbi:MAG: hypothetical protein F6K19_14050 [Cyanothece sp. SIO1E1]|nr:hypothetical protein [Cyanothece sp. SIO1E1]
MKIGIVGYSAQKFDVSSAKSFIQRAFDLFASYQPEIVSGLTNMGIPGLAYQEACKRGWKTVGISCNQALRYDCFPVDDQIIIGEQWGDESQKFLSLIDVLVRIGGGSQSYQECQMAKDLDKAVIEFDLPALQTTKNAS